LDVLLGEAGGWDLLSEIKREPTTRDIPVLVVTNTESENQAVALGADDFCPKPVDQRWLLESLRRFSRGAAGPERVLIIDDDEVARYLLRRSLEGTPYTVVEAANGYEGLQRAREERPQVIFLDMAMPEMSGPEVLAALKADPLTRDIPVIIHTSRPMPPEEVSRLPGVAAGVLAKDPVSREKAVARVREALARAGVSPRREESRG
jgi:CheY-like chemotaxis protein